MFYTPSLMFRDKLSATTLLLLFSMIVVTTGCKKGSVPVPKIESKYYIQFKADGIQKKYSTRFAGTIAGPTDSIYAAILGAFKNYDSTKLDSQEQFIITLFSNTKIQSGTVIKEPDRPISSKGFPLQAAHFTYFDDQLYAYVTNGNGLDSAGGQLISPDLVDDATATFSDVTEIEMKGTFSGTMRRSSNPVTTIHITEGKFFLPRD